MSPYSSLRVSSRFRLSSVISLFGFRSSSFFKRSLMLSFEGEEAHWKKKPFGHEHPRRAFRCRPFNTALLF